MPAGSPAISATTTASCRWRRKARNGLAALTRSQTWPGTRGAMPRCHAARPMAASRSSSAMRAGRIWIRAMGGQTLQLPYDLAAARSNRDKDFFQRVKAFVNKVSQSGGSASRDGAAQCDFKPDFPVPVPVLAPTQAVVGQESITVMLDDAADPS